MTKSERRKLSADGIPIDAKLWTEDDWRDLHKAMENAKQQIADRHQQQDAKGGEA